MDKKVNDIQLSVIIPAYNAESVIKECLDSVISQRGVNFEIIVVNDGSTDNTLGVCQEIMNKFPVVRVFSQNNQGVSVARNVGIQQAKGTWVMFLDSDDRLLEGAFNNFDFDSNASIIVFGYKRCFGIVCGTDKEEKLPSHTMQKMILNYPKYNEEMQIVRTIDEFSNFTCWARLFRRELLINKNISFPAGITHGEDLLFCYSYLKYADTVSIVDRKIYYYNVNDSSVTHRFNKKSLFNTKMLIMEMLSIDCDLIDNADFYNFVASRITARCMDFFAAKENKDDFSERARQLKSFCKEPIFNVAIKKCDKWKLSTGKFERIKKGIVVIMLQIKCYTLAILSAGVLNKLKLRRR